MARAGKTWVEGNADGDRLLVECFATPLHSLEGHVLQHSKEPGTLMSLFDQLQTVACLVTESTSFD